MRALWKHIEEREASAASLAAAAETEGEKGSPTDDCEVDPTIFDSQEKGPDLLVHMSEHDPLHEDISKG